MLYNIFPESIQTACLPIALVLGFALAFLFTAVLKDKLPKDGGRAYAVEGAKSAGKPRGAGIVFILVFAIVSLLFLPFSYEYGLYYVLVLIEMMTGFLDDAAKSPWGEYLKGALDLVVAVLTAVVFLFNNTSDVHLALFGVTFHMPVILYGVLAVLLIWMSINVTNCSDGVDSLSGSVSIVVLMTFYGLMQKFAVAGDFAPQILVLVLAIVAYLWFNSTPSILMMGDAGSRAIGMFIAIAAMKSGMPIIFLLAALVLILDGGLGLLKVSLIRFLKIHILKNVRTPLHDQVRKVNGWSNTQCVFRFVIIQLVIGIVIYFVSR